MAFRRIQGFEGKIYTPDITPERLKKHDCDDCLVCQMCSDERCEICLRDKCPGERRARGKIYTGEGI